MTIHFHLHLFSTQIRWDNETFGQSWLPTSCMWQLFTDSFTLHSKSSNVNLPCLNNHSAGALHHGFPQSWWWQVYFIPDGPLVDSLWIWEPSFWSTLWFILDQFKACNPGDFMPWVVGMASRLHYIVKCFFTNVLTWHLAGMGWIPSSYDFGLQLWMSLSHTLLTIFDVLHGHYLLVGVCLEFKILLHRSVLPNPNAALLTMM